MAEARRFVFELTGGELCLDFANTVDQRGNPAGRVDHLATFPDLAAWSRQAGIVAPVDERAMLRAAARQPGTARSVLERAIRLREAIYTVFSALAARRPVPSTALTDLMTELRAALAHVDLQTAVPPYRWGWRSDREAVLDKPLWAVAKSAADLLTSDRVLAVRGCASETCWWLFLDTSRNRSRRWCDMKVCGNREKARRFYQRSAAQR
jgi:predicted RNA-binding Zn ribbon-like protein